MQRKVSHRHDKQYKKAQWKKNNKKNLVNFKNMKPILSVPLHFKLSSEPIIISNVFAFKPLCVAVADN